MAKFITKLLLTAVLLLTAGITQTHIYQIEKWSNGSQDIYCLNDYHRSAEPHNQICNQQQIDIVSMAKKYNAFVIVEDTMFSNLNNLIANPLQFDPNENYTNRLNNNTFKLENIKNDRPPITGLTAHCHYAQIPVDNVEFRNIKNISLLNGLIDSEIALTYSGMIREQILAYNDGQILNDYYKKKIDEYLHIIQPCTNFFNHLCEQNCSLKEAIPLVSYDRQLDQVSLPHVQLHLMNEDERKQYIVDYYDTTLMDLRIIHSIHTHNNYKNIFVCAGGGHIERIEPALRLMGFSYVDYYHVNDDTNNYPEPTALNIHDYFTTQTKTHNARPLPSLEPQSNTSLIARLFSWLMVTLFG